MFKIMAKSNAFYFFLSFCFSVFLIPCLCTASPIRNSTEENLIPKGKISNGASEQLVEAGKPGSNQTGDISLKSVWDSAKYISIDEIKPGMKAYCLTCYKGTEIEKFDVDILSVVHDITPGRDAILVQGTDERFIHTGPVGGCSGSPVYIEGRLAGAMAFGWYFSKDPLYGVTPIEEMLRVGQAEGKKRATSDERRVTSYSFDLSKPIDFVEIERQITTQRPSSNDSLGGFTTLPCPLVVSGLPTGACEQLNTFVEPFGLMAVSGISGSVDTKQAENVQLAPGSVLTVPLVAGDIKMAVLGTVTEVQADKVYGFGHSFLGYGQVNLPMATGQVHTVVSNLARSFKLGSALEIVGALTADESAAVFGQIGTEPQMIPLKIRVSRYNDTEQRVYNCRLAYNRLLTPVLLRAALYGAVFQLGDFPPDHMIEYKVEIGIEDGETISFNNVSTEIGVAEVASESFGSVLLLMNNPYKEVDIKSIDFDISIEPRNIVSRIWSVDLSDTEVKAGQEIGIDVVVESFLAEKKKHQLSLQLPEQIKPGKYQLILSGTYEYERFLRKAVPYRFIANNISALLKALNNVLGIRRDRLYCLLMLPPDGIALEGAELPDLPPTKALILQNNKRAIRAQPFSHWLETSVRTDSVIADRKIMRITVEK